MTRGDAGRYGPDSEAWRLNRESMLLLGAGPRALLLQLAHPSVAAGVAEHSDFRADPWKRLAGTLRSYLTIVYGTTAAANGEIRRLNTMHRGIVGTGYSARDPALSMWVHATLVDSTIAAYHAWLEPLSRARRETFYAETLPIGRAFGVPEELLPDVPRVGAVSVADRSGPGVGGRARPGGDRAAAATGPVGRPAARADRGRRVGAGTCPGGELRVDVVALGRTPAGERARGLRAVVGPARAGGLGLARRPVAYLATVAPGRVPPDAEGDRCGSADGLTRTAAQ